MHQYSSALSDLVQGYFRFEGHRLQIINGYSGAEVCRLMQQHPDTAILLVDVVMERDQAGLDAENTFLNELNNYFVHIILRTGQAPESKVISEYDINDYKDKSNLT